MRKRLAFWGKVGLALLVIAIIVAMTGQYESARRKYQSDCQSKIPKVLPANAEQNQTAPTECQDAKEYMPWGYVLISWPDGITLWALLATLGVIAYQSYHTRRAADGALLNAEAALKQTKLSEQQVALMFRKERGMLEIKGNGIEIEDGPGRTWSLVGDIQLSNSGNNPLRVFGGEGECLVLKMGDYIPMTGGRRLQKIGLDSDWIRTNDSGIREGLWSDEIGKSKTQFARMLANYEVKIILHGTIDYESLGSAWRRFYGFRWISDKSDSVEGITKGRWVEDSEEMENQEYEIPAPPEVPF